MENFSNKKFNYFQDNNTKVEIEFENCSEWYDYCGMKVCDAPFHFIENGRRCEGNYPYGVIAYVDGQYYWFTSIEQCINSFNQGHKIY